MLERIGRVAGRREGLAAAKVSRSRKLGFDPLEGRALMAAALAPIANITVPAALGYQVPLNGTGGGASQTYTVTSSNSDVKATVAKGDFLTFNVTHTSSGQSGDQSFTGSLTFQLFNDLTPITVSRIEQLVNSGFYTNTSFYRITPISTATDTIAQGGSNGTKISSLPSTGFPFQNELQQQLAFTNGGELAMANAGFSNQNGINTADYFSNSSEFFVTSTATRFLDFGYTIYGQLVADPEGTLAKIDSVPLSAGTTTPASPVTITSASLATTNPDGDIHVDATGASAGESSIITVTAFDPATNSTTAQSFTATVGPTNPFNPTTNTGAAAEKPFLDVYPDVTQPLQTSENQPEIFQVQGISPGSPSDPLTYTVAGSTTTTQAAGSNNVTFNAIPTSQGTATVSPNGLVTFTPAANFTGNVTILVGVRDQIDRSGKGLNDASNYDVKQYTINVSGSTTPVDRTPVAQPVTVTATAGTATQVQLNGLSATTGTNQNLTYAIATQPTHGTLTLVNASTGLASYTPTGNYIGPDSFTYTVTDNGNTTNRVSAPGTVTINVTSGVTGAVRLIGSVLVVTPPPNPTRHQDQIAITQTSGSNPVIQVEVNGVIDSTQPNPSSLDEIVVYGSKTGTSTVVSPAVNVPVSLDTGHGGTNFINAAASADTEIRAWFGHGAVQGGSGTNAIVGRIGHLNKVVKSPGTDSVFLSGIAPYHRVPHFKVAGAHLKAQNLGAFYKFVGKRLVKTNQPVSTLLKQNQS